MEVEQVGIRLITDSGADLPESIIRDLNLTVAPLVVMMDGQQYADGEDMKSTELFKAMRSGKAPTTSQVPVERFQSIFTEVAKANETALYIALSSELSGTYQAGVLAREAVQREYPNLDLTIIDSRCASLGEGLAVVLTARYAAAGHANSEIIEAAKFYCQHMQHLFTVDDLVYLMRGGRVSKASAILGGILDIKPLLNVEDGKLVPLEKIRGGRRVFKRMVELMGERGTDLSGQTVAISHGDDLDRARELRDLIAQQSGVQNFVINDIGCTIGAHAGPGTIALFFLDGIMPG
jgi:DegV family protein with EDD domain